MRVFSLTVVFLVLPGCGSNQEKSAEQQVARNLIETAERIESDRRAAEVAEAEAHPAPELPLPERIEDRTDARRMMLAVQSRVKGKPAIEVTVGHLTAKLEYSIQEEALWINAVCRFPKGTASGEIINLLPEAIEATQLNVFTGMSEYVKHAATDRGWYADDGAEHSIPPVTEHFFEKSGSLASFAPDDQRGPILTLGVQFRE